jgi:glycosyl transferase family 25
MFVKNFPTSCIAILLSHLYAYKQISEKYDDGLIFEDDVILSDDFLNIYNKYINQLPIDYDMFFIGDGCNLHIEKNKLLPDKNVYEKCLYPTNWGGDGATRCIDSYLVNKKCATEMLNYFNNLTEKITTNLDWFLNIVIRSKQFKIYWAEPTIVTQGSKNGMFRKSY